MKKFHHINWQEFDHLLGKITDQEVSEKIGCTRSSVGKRRELLGIPRYKKSTPKNEIIYCKCGCGNTLNKYSDDGRKREFLPSHWSKTQPKVRIKLNCEYCGKEIEKIPSHAKKVKLHFCNMKCQGKYASENDLKKGKNNGHYNTITVPCNGCGKPVSKAKSLIKRRNNRVYCKNCVHLVRQGKKGFYVGYPKDFNAKLRHNIRKRDNFTCQLYSAHQDNCGTLHVHHIDYNKNNNSTKNLISLCNKCHGYTNFGTAKWQKKFNDMIEKIY